MNQRHRAGDAVTNAGNALGLMPAVLHAAGTLVAYAANLDFFWLPANVGTDRLGRAGILTGYQVTLATPGAGASGSDVLRLQLIDQSAEVAGAGTVSTTGTAVTGSGTSFLTFFKIGQYVRSGATTFKIGAIADATHLTLEAAPAVDWSSAAYVRVPTLSTLATITMAANVARVLPVDLRSGPVGASKGITILPGQGFRLDMAGISTGGTQPASVRVKLDLGVFGLDG